MAFVPGFRHDIFVSYAHVDNDHAAYPDGWVGELVARLKSALRQRLGGGDELNICFDAGMRANQQLETLLESARGSALFLAIGSRAYVTREWTLKELQAFADTRPDLGRCFVAECLPLRENEVYPAPIKSHHRLAFHRKVGPTSQTSMTISPLADSERFNQVVHDLAEQMSDALLALRQAGAADAVEAKPRAAEAATNTSTRKVVLLAETTDDLEDERDQLRRYLEQFGIEVLPQGAYPQGGQDFAKAFAVDAARADLFVQLLGPRPGKRPPDVPKGYVHRQAELAKELGLGALQWRSTDLDLGKVTDQDHRRMLTGETAVVSGLEAFKQQVKEKVTAPSPKSRSKPISLAFINSDSKDLDFARSVKDEFVRSNVMAALPVFNKPSQENRLDLEENLIDCDVLVLVYGQVTPEWVRGQLRYFSKVTPRRTHPPRAIALCLAPPEDKVGIEMSMPGLRELQCFERDLGAVRSLIQELDL